MQFRWWNSFNLLAVVLLAIGIAGAVSGGHMIFDPGRIPSGREWTLYVIAGALMLVNGFLPPSHVPEEAVPAQTPVPVAAAAADQDNQPASQQ